MDGFEKDSMTGKNILERYKVKKLVSIQDIFIYNKKCLFPHSLFQMT